MHSSQPFSIPLAIITLLTTLSSTTSAQSTTKSATSTLKLTTVAPYPSTWTVSANCFSKVPAVDDNQETIYNMGCGAQVRRSCCPPNWTPGVIFGDMTSTVGGTRGICPSGYVDRPAWGGLTGGPVLTKAGGRETTVVCCPSAISLWSLFGLSQTPLCFTQNPSSRADTQLSDPFYVSTYARPFFFAVEAVVTATSASESTSSTPTTGSKPTTGSTTTGLGTTAGGSSPTETGGGGDGGLNGGNPGQGEKSGLSSGAIAGIVIGVLAPIAIGIIAFIFWRRKRSHGMGRGMDPPVPPPAQSSADKYSPFDDSISSSYGLMETGTYRYKLPVAGSETILSSNPVGMRNGENEERRVAVFENAEKLPEPSENEAVYAQQNYKFGGSIRR